MTIRSPGIFLSILMLAAAGAIPALAASSGYPMVEKWNAPRIFHEPFRADYERQVVIGPARVFPENLPGGQRVYSPNGGYWYLMETPNFNGAKPWATQIYIYNDRADLMKLELKDHGNATPEAIWINEKLLYINLWWGRVLGSYMILDVEREVFVAKEMLVDGAKLYQQYQESKAYIR